MKPRQFLIASLIAAGFGQTSAAQDRFTGVTSGDDAGPPGGFLEQAYAREHLFTLAGHRSHSSHSSHSSHRSSYGGGGHSSHVSHTSHRSSAGGYAYPTYVTPTLPDVPASNDNPEPTLRRERGNTAEVQGLLEPRTTGRSAAAPGALPALTGRSERFRLIVCRVQVALAARDLYKGIIDCAVGPQLRSAIRAFQSSHGMEVTGTITPQVLDGLLVSTD